MIIPIYVQELMQRARYEYDRCTENENYGVGYTVAIRKACRDHCRRIPGYGELPKAEQEKIYRAMLEIAGA